MVISQRMLGRWVGAVSVIATAFTLTTADAVAQVVLRDGFDGRPALAWRPVRPEPSHVSWTAHPGRLTITTQRGSIHGEEKLDAYGGGVQAKNLYLIDNPLAAEADFEMTAVVTGFTPGTSYQQAGLIVYQNDDNYLKWGYEYDWPHGGGQSFAFIRETAAVPQHVYTDSPDGLVDYRVRLTKRGSAYEYAAGPADGELTIYGEGTWEGQPLRIGLLAKNGGNADAPEVEVAFDQFEFRSLTAVRRGDDAREERGGPAKAEADRDDADGQEQEIPLAKLPKPIAKVLRGLEIEAVEKSTEAGVTQYEIEIEVGESEVELTLDAEGRLLAVEIEQKEDEGERD